MGWRPAEFCDCLISSHNSLVGVKFCYAMGWGPGNSLRVALRVPTCRAGDSPWVYDRADKATAMRAATLALCSANARLAGTLRP